MSERIQCPYCEDDIRDNELEPIIPLFKQNKEQVLKCQFCSCYMLIRQIKEGKYETDFC